MQVSFVVTSYNIEAYIQKCLETLAGCVRAGDQVIVVDDGSTDQTVARIRASFLEGYWGADIEFVPVLLAKNTHGGVGIAANIGLAHATREAVFFVDGDDWVVPNAVHAARDAFAAGGYDLLLANYRVFDEDRQIEDRPSDAELWSQVPVLSSGREHSRDLALEMNSVPWRKFYRRSFLDGLGLRFPEGDFFYEDNPFHWSCCLRAETIGFLDVCVAFHRMNRQGQTMSDTGAGFSAIFSHYERIVAEVASVAPKKQTAVDRWLARNMAWQLERMSVSVIPAYAAEAERSLTVRRKARWQELYQSELITHPTGFLIGSLLSGGAMEFVQTWMTWTLTRKMERQIPDIERRLLQLEEQSVKSNGTLDHVRSYTLRALNQLEFQVLRSIEKDRGEADLNEDK